MLGLKFLLAIYSLPDYVFYHFISLSLSNICSFIYIFNWLAQYNHLPHYNQLW
jgi:hypothetical protein